MQFSKEILKGAAELIVLSALSDRKEAYGYELIQTIARGSKNIFEFQEGTLYPLLYRLEDKGYVTSSRKVTPSSKERRYYRLTRKGRAMLSSQQKEYRVFLQGLKHVLHAGV